MKLQHCIYKSQIKLSIHMNVSSYKITIKNKNSMKTSKKTEKEDKKFLYK